MHPHKREALKSLHKKVGGVCEGYGSGGDVADEYHKEGKEEGSVGQQPLPVHKVDHMGASSARMEKREDALRKISGWPQRPSEGRKPWEKKRKW